MISSAPISQLIFLLLLFLPVISQSSWSTGGALSWFSGIIVSFLKVYAHINYVCRVGVRDFSGVLIWKVGKVHIFILWYWAKHDN